MARKRAGRAKANRLKRRATSWNSNSSSVRFRRTQPNRWKWAGQEDPTASGSYSTVEVIGIISSSNRRIRRLPGVTSDELERWFYIQNGALPPGTDTAYKPLTDDDMMEKASDAMTPFDLQATKEAEYIADEATEEVTGLKRTVDNLQNRADTLWADTDPETKPASHAAARRIEAERIAPIVDEEIPDVLAERDKKLEVIREALREKRTEVKEDLKREQIKSIERFEDYMYDLKHRELQLEVQRAADRYFQEEDLFELESFNLS